MSENPKETEARSTSVRLPHCIELKPPVSAEDPAANTENDPEGAEEFVALIRALRNEGRQPVAL